MPRHAQLVKMCPETPCTNRVKLCYGQVGYNQAMFRSSKLNLGIVFLGLNLLFFIPAASPPNIRAEAVLPHAELHPANIYRDNKNMPQVKMHQDSQNIISLQEAPR